MGDAAGKALIVGVSWHSTNREIGMLKSLALGEWRPVLEVPGVHFVDLQYGDAAAERAHVEMQAGNRIFTQQASGDWRETLESVAREIATFVDDKRAASGEP